MSQALRDLLANRYDEPPTEITRIKEYVQEHFKTAVAVSMRGEQIIITTRSSALAGALRPQLQQLAAYSKTKKRLIIRIA